MAVEPHTGGWMMTWLPRAQQALGGRTSEAHENCAFVLEGRGRSAGRRRHIVLRRRAGRAARSETMERTRPAHGQMAPLLLLLLLAGADGGGRVGDKNADALLLCVGRWCRSNC